MIRPYAEEDLGQIFDITRETELMFKPAEIKERMADWESVVWDSTGTIGGAACWQKEEDGEFNLNIFVDPALRGKGIGMALFDRCFDAIQSLGERGRITVRYRLDSGDSQRFFRNRGFTNWYGMDFLAYDGQLPPAQELPQSSRIDTYEDAYFEPFVAVMGDAFIPQRRFFDFRPHDVRELHKDEAARERLLKAKDDKFVLLHKGEVVAMAEVEGNFIDTVGVTLAGRGHGFGRSLMNHCMKVIRDRGHEVIETSVVLGNVPAWRLYNTLGFKRIQMNEYACRWI